MNAARCTRPVSPARSALARWAAAVCVVAGIASGAWAQGEAGDSEDQFTGRPAQIRGMEVEEKLGAPLPLELTFTNAEGQTVQLADYFGDNKPAIIGLVYFKCPIVCSVLMEKLSQSLRDVDLTVGEDFRVLLFSFDFTETTDLAAKLKAYHLAGYNREVTQEVRDGWQFHTSDSASAKQLANALGFKYRRLDNGEYTHPVALFFVSPEGKISRYLYGFTIPPRDVKLSLIDASSGRLARSLGDRLSFFCYEYDPEAGAYTLQAVRVMQVAGIATMVGLGGLITALFVGERVRRRLAGSGGRGGAGDATDVNSAAADAASTGTDR